jgi:hypothetical protein
VIIALQMKGVTTIAAPLPLTSLSDDVIALDRASERVQGQLVLVGHAYAGAVIGSTRNQRVKSLVYVAGLAPASHSVDHTPGGSARLSGLRSVGYAGTKSVQIHF